MKSFNVILAVFILTGCGSTLKLDSDWRQQEITIDGKQSDWQDALTFVEKKDVSIGVANDGEFLYICLVSADRILPRQMVRRGFTVWIDPKGGKDKTFGIRFPIGMLESGMMEEAMGRGRGRDEAIDPERMKELFEQTMSELEILGPEKEDRHRYSMSELEGLEVKIGEPADGLVYEIKVPLYKTEQYPIAVGLAEGEKIGVGFETVEFDRSALRQRRGGGGFGGGRGGGRRGFRGGRGGFGSGFGGGRSQMASEFKLWAFVELGTKKAIESAKVEVEENQQQDR
ncbi:MAG: hypothetical protein ACE5G1_03360 [bacterium]